MPVHIDPNDPKYGHAAAEILRRHDNFEPEANITSAVRDFLILTGLAKSEEMVEENPPAEASRRAVDLTALDTFIEFKRRIGTTSGGEPDPENVQQLDDYLAQSASQGRVRMGVLTDGKRWLLRWPGAGDVRLDRPYAFTLEGPDGWFPLYEWLRDSALASLEGVSPDREGIAGHFGPDSPSYQRDIAALKALYEENSGLETIGVKRRLWYDLLRTALGEIAYTTEGMSAESQARLAAVGVGAEEMDDLFVRHTYLGAVIGMVVQASFGIDIRRLAATDPADLLQGRELHSATGLQGVLESDFFAWPNEVGGNPLMQTLARRVARFDWIDAPADTAATLYETIIPPEERRQLGEYYTPAWLVRAMIRELVDDPLKQRVLDPACGSGTFVAEAVSHFIAAAGKTNLAPWEVLNRLRQAVTGIDVHPVAVHLARAAWTLAARPAINAATPGTTPLSIPVYLGDALQLRFRTGDLFSEKEVTIRTMDDENTELVFPVSHGGAGRELRRPDGRRFCLHRTERRPRSSPGRQPHQRPRRAADHRQHHSRHAAAPRPGARPHLGLLHPQHGAASGAVALQGGRGDRQPSLDQLQPDRRHPAGRIARASAGIATASGPGATTPPNRTLRGCSSPAASTCT